MKKSILFVLVLAVVAACSTRNNNKNKSLGLKGFSAYYNTLFNSKDALETELKNRKKNHRDNFYDPYIKILTTEEQLASLQTQELQTGGLPMQPGIPQGPAGENVAGNGINYNSSSSSLPSPFPTNANAGGRTSALQISEAKALKALSKYSVIKNEQEKNKKMFNASLLLAQARLYQDRPLEALDALNYIFVYMKNDKRLDLAKIYQAQAYAQMQDYYHADEIFRSLNDLSKAQEKLKSIYYAQMLVDAGKKEEAVAELENAYTANKDRKLRSRIAFLRGQALASLGKNEEARESFRTAYKQANDFEFEVKSQIEIAKTFNGKDDDYEGAKKYLEEVAKKGTYASRKNEFYYALGIMAHNAGKEDEAQAFYHKALSEKISDPQLRGLTYYEIGKHYFDKNDYIAAGAYYDSATAVMNYEPTRAKLTDLAGNIKKIRDNYYLIKKNDSILALSRMNEADRRSYFAKYITELQAKEAKINAQKKSEARDMGFDTGDYNTNSIFSNSSGFQDLGSSRSGFYFANQNTITKGESDFRQIWGSRAPEDNWRYSSRASTLQDIKNETMGISTVQEPRRFDPEFYIEKIPTDAEVLGRLKNDRDTASLELARMYDNFFSNTALATKILYDLADSNPEQEIKLQALYQAFSMNYEKNPTAAEKAKTLILKEFPYTSYAEFVKNPKNTAFSKSTTEVEKVYKQAFDYYAAEKYEDSKALIEAAMAKYPQDALIPKFALLNAYNAGKTAGKEIMILQLQQLALNYKNTPEGEKASTMLNYMKSDLSPQNPDTSITPADLSGVAPAAQAKAAANQQNTGMPVPQINTSENVVQPQQQSTMPTSPPVRPNDPSGTPPRPPGSLPTSGVGQPVRLSEKINQ